jgi:hypothetical protein
MKTLMRTDPSQSVLVAAGHSSSPLFEWRFRLVEIFEDASRLQLEAGPACHERHTDFGLRSIKPAHHHSQAVLNIISIVR